MGKNALGGDGGTLWWGDPPWWGGSGGDAPSALHRKKDDDGECAKIQETGGYKKRSFRIKSNYKRDHFAAQLGSPPI